MVEAESKRNQGEDQLLDTDENEGTHNGDQNSANRTATINNCQEDHCCQVLEELYDRITNETNTTKLEKVLLSSSYPSPISLKLHGIQEMLKDNGRLDTASINFAIRKLRREETIDRSPTNSESLVCKYFFGTDFARLAIEDGLSDLETCVRNDFVYLHHNSFGQDADSSKKEVLFIPVNHHGCWSLYAFNISDQKLSILDPTSERAFNMSHQKLSIFPTPDGSVREPSVKQSSMGQLLAATPESEHDNSRLKICRALEFVKENFNLFKNASGKFSSWRYEFADISQFRKSYEDSGFFVFNFMRGWWDGHQVIQLQEMSKDPKVLRKGFLKYIVSFKFNEVYDEPGNLADIFGALEKLNHHAQNVSGHPAWTRRCKMDTDLLKAVRGNNVENFAKLFEVSSDSSSRILRQKLRRGATCDGDGVLHIAARYGDLELLCAIFKEVHIELNLEALKERLPEVTCSMTSTNDVFVEMIREVERPQQMLAGLLRSRNHKGETCLHEAVRHGDGLFVLALILADEKIMDVGIKSIGPALVQILDYEGVSPLYLATSLGRSEIVRIVLGYHQQDNKGSPAAGNRNGGSGVPEDQDRNGGTNARGGHARESANKFNFCGLLQNLQKLILFMSSRTDPSAFSGSGAPGDPNCIASFSGPGGKTAMHAAVVLNKGATGVTKQLLNWRKQHDRDVPDLTVMSDNAGNTPLHLVSSVHDGAAIAKLLLSAGTCVAALKKDSKGWLPIHVAAANGRLDVIKELIDKCPECMESRNASGQSFLHVAIEKRRRNVVKYVCSQKSLAGILNLTDQDGNTALHLAVESGNQLIFCAIMGNPRVHLSYENRQGRTPLDVAMLSLGPGMRLLMSSRVLIYRHLRQSGAHYGTCRRDALTDEIAGQLDKDKLSETMSKSAGLLAVCSIFMLNISVATFFNLAKQHLLDPNAAAAAAAPAPAPLAAAAAAAAGGRSASRVRANSFQALIALDAITFTCALVAAFCSTFAGFPLMDRPARLIYFNIASMCFQIGSLGLVAIFVLAAYLAFSPVYPYIVTLTCGLPLLVVIPHVMTPQIRLIPLVWTLYRRKLMLFVFSFFFFSLLLFCVSVVVPKMWHKH